MKVACPRCGKEQPWSSDNEWRPFCSERCKMLDLGHWMQERYSITDENGEDPKDKHPEEEPPD